MSTPRVRGAASAPPRAGAVGPHRKIEFTEDGDIYTGTGESGRQWRVRRVLTGWQLDFLDKGDTRHTNAGIHVSLAAAQAEAVR